MILETHKGMSTVCQEKTPRFSQLFLSALPPPPTSLLKGWLQTHLCHAHVTYMTLKLHCVRFAFVGECVREKKYEFILVNIYPVW